ncbi:MAG: flagellar export protein FliJ [Vulcanibacillus sp.]
MSTFYYSFQKILDLKKKNREQTEYMYAELVHNLKLEEEKSSILNKNKNEIYEIIHSQQLVGTSIIELCQYESYLMFIEQQMLIYQKNIYRINNLIKEKHKELVEIKIEERKWSNLREKKYRDYIIECNKLEQKELDEIASRGIQRGV